MKIILASSNEHKKKEIEQLFVGHEILLPKELGLSFDCVEDGQTFIDNALIKAKALRQVLKDAGDYAVLADDSGLIVDALPGQLGVKTARFGSKDGVTLLEPHEKNQLLLSKLIGLKEEERTARFVCAMVLIKKDWTVYCVQECSEGRILEREIGEHGFGYDPVFYCKEAQSPMALLSDEGKNRCSHRGKAARSMLKLIS
jgi:XTP/dITP diphosphohydrolase